MPTVVLNSTATLFVSTSEATYAAARQKTGTNLYTSDFGWIGQYHSGSAYDVSQVFASFDLTGLPANAQITSAKLVLTVPESYGNHTVEVRSSTFTTGNAASFIAGSQLASRTLLGSTAFTAGFGFEREIALSNLTPANLASVVLHGAGQRTNTAPTGDTTTRVTAVRLEVTYDIVITTTGPGTWSVPAGVTSATVEVWGGGGGGNVHNAAGGGGGAYSVSTLTVTPDQSVSYSVGAAGVGLRVTPYAAATNGGDTWFSSTSILLAKGGSANGTGGAASQGVGTTRRTGGNGTAWAGGTGGQGPGAGGGGSAHPTGNGGNAMSGTTSSAGFSGPSGSRAGVINAVGASNVLGGSGGHGFANAGGAPGGGGGSDGNSNLGGAGGRGQIRITYTAEAAPPADTTPPTITSASSARVGENTPNPTGTLTADETVTWSKNGGADQALFSISGSTWTLNATPNFEAKSSYDVIWRATDVAGNATDQTFTLNITDVDEIAPTITSSASPSAAENTVNPSGTLTANEAVTWSKVGGTDQALFSLSGATWTLGTTPDFETKAFFTVVWRATDAAGNWSEQTMALGIADVDETPPEEPVEEIVTYTEDASFTVQPGETSITFAAHGGGGAGYKSQTQNSGAGGGGGAFAGSILPVSAGDLVQITVGVGGAQMPDASTDPRAPNGGDTTVRINGVIVVRAAGGLGGPGRSPPLDYNDGIAFAGAGGAIADSIGQVRWRGGAGWSGGQYGSAGGAGGAASPTGNGVNGSYRDGGAAGPGGAPATIAPDYFTLMIDGASDPEGGAGGHSGGGSNFPKRHSSGGFPGGGGGGQGQNGQPSGAGAGGQVIVTRQLQAQPPARLLRSFTWF